MDAAALLDCEIDGVAVGRPLRRALAIINSRSDFPTIAAVSVHHPYVRVLHGGLAVGQAATGAAVNDVLSIRRPKRLVFVVFGGGEPANAAVGDAQRENVVVEEFVLIRLAIGDK